MMIYAMVSDQGTACAETALCPKHLEDEDTRFQAHAELEDGIIQLQNQRKIEITKAEAEAFVQRIGAGIGDKALSDAALFARVAAHRAIFFRKSPEAHKSLRPGSLRLLPHENQRALWAQDYEAMREVMFFGETPAFAEILSVVGDFERRFNTPP